MPLFPLPVEQFGGLNLLDAPDEIGFSGALDMADVDLDKRGRVRSRDFFGTLTANTSQDTPQLIPWGNKFVGTDGTTVKLFNSGGALIGSAAAPASSALVVAQPFGTPSNSYLYIADANLVNTVRRLDSTATLTAPAGMPKTIFLGHTPWDNRLVAANIGTVPAGSTATASGSLIYFSDAGNGESWGANNWLQLDPGDGEQILGVCTWRNLMFVFKSTKYYIFYGTDVDATGQPIFNYRTVNTGIGLGNASAVVAGYSGVYFVGTTLTGNNRGTHVYVTTGAEPQVISSPIDPALNGRAPTTFSPGNIVNFNGGIDFLDRRFYMSVTCSGSVAGGFFIYDEILGEWLFYAAKTGAPKFTGFPALGNLLLAGTGVNAPVYRLDQSYGAETYNAGFNAYYQSGFDNIAPPRRFAAHYLFGNTRKRIRKWKVTGTGTVNLAIAHDFGATGTASTLALGVSPAVKDAWHNIAGRGQLFSYKLSSTAAWSVQKLTAYLAGSEPPLLGNPSDK